MWGEGLAKIIENFMDIDMQIKRALPEPMTPEPPIRKLTPPVRCSSPMYLSEDLDRDYSFDFDSSSLVVPEFDELDIPADSFASEGDSIISSW